MTLLEAAKAVVDLHKRAQEELSKPCGEHCGQRKGICVWNKLETAILHEADERRDFERLLKIVDAGHWLNAYGCNEEELNGLIEQILWRRKAIAEKAARAVGEKI